MSTRTEQDSVARERLRPLVEGAARRAAEREEPLAWLRGVALYDTRKDETITSLPAYAPAVEALSEHTLVRERYGSGNAPRLAVQFVYETGKRLQSPVFDEPVFEATWEHFVEELHDPDWVHRGVANVRYFKSDVTLIDLGDGVTIRGRNFDELGSMGFDEHILAALEDDWFGFGSSSFVIVAEHRSLKEPDDFVVSDAATPTAKAQRAVWALRMSGPGDVGLGRMHYTRASRFNVGIGGVHSTGPIPETFGEGFTYDPTQHGHVVELAADLKHLQETEYRDATGNLGLALRSFMSTYDRWPSANDSRLVDSITALEAVLGTPAETSFRLSFRVAALLAQNDDERASLFESVREFYDTRSLVVHGMALNDKHEARLKNVGDLRGIVRTLLRGLIRLARPGDERFNRTFFERDLDRALLRTDTREELRAAMGLMDRGRRRSEGE